MDDVLEHDPEATLTLDQLVESYMEDNSHNLCTEVDSRDLIQNDHNSPNSNTNKVTTEISDPNKDIGLPFLTEDENIEDSSKNTCTLTQYLEKECYCNKEWCNKSMFPASLDRQSYKKIDIIQYVGDNLQMGKKTMTIIEYILILPKIQ